MARAGTGSRAFGMNTEDSGDLEASKVRFNYPNSIHVTADKILVGSYSGTVDEFNENLFTAANKDTAWLQQMGGGAVSRWTGVKQAMATIALIPNGRFVGHISSYKAGHRLDCELIRQLYLNQILVPLNEN